MAPRCARTHGTSLDRCVLLVISCPVEAHASVRRSGVSMKKTRVMSAILRPPRMVRSSSDEHLELNPRRPSFKRRSLHTDSQSYMKDLMQRGSEGRTESAREIDFEQKHGD